MSWKRLVLGVRPHRTHSKLHLDESVPASVERMLTLRGYHFSTSKKRHLIGHSDADQAALCWREDRTLVTFDWDFFGMEDVPHHRTPGIVIVDCDRLQTRLVTQAIDTFAKYDHLIGAVSRRMHVVVRADGEISIWTSANLRKRPNARYRFDEQLRPLAWIV